MYGCMYMYLAVEGLTGPRVVLIPGMPIPPLLVIIFKVGPLVLLNISCFMYQVVVPAISPFKHFHMHYTIPGAI